jgi:hypothetical protein
MPAWRTCRLQSSLDRQNVKLDPTLLFCPTLKRVLMRKWVAFFPRSSRLSEQVDDLRSVCPPTCLFDSNPPIDNTTAVTLVLARTFAIAGAGRPYLRILILPRQTIHGRDARRTSSLSRSCDRCAVVCEAPEEAGKAGSLPSHLI